MRGHAELYRRLRPEGEADDALDAHLDAALALARAHAKTRGFEVDENALVEALAALPNAIGALDEARIQELSLCLAAARGEPAALSAIDADWMPPARGALSAMALSEPEVEDILQEVRRKLFTSKDAGPPAISRYAGRGSLRGLLKVSASRAGISYLRKRVRERPGDDALVDRTGESDPELAFLKRHYRGAFRAAFEEAVGALSQRERNLLRLHFMRKVTLEALATMYGVHRATITRHLASARATLERETRRQMGRTLSLPPSELDEVMALIRSRMDVSVDRLLATIDAE